MTFRGWLFWLSSVGMALECMSQVKPCHPEEFSLDQRKKLCADRSPISGSLLLRSSKRVSCECDCTTFPEVYPSIDTLDLFAAEFPLRLRVWASRFSSGSATCDNNVRFKVTAEGSQVFVCTNATLCAIDDRVALIAQKAVVAMASAPYHTSVGIDIGSNDGGSVSPVTSCPENRSELIGEVSVEHTLTGCAAPGNDYSDHIVLPRKFLDHPAVGDELIVFFLLHEAAHLQCTTRTEVECDHWAISDGLPLFFGHQWTPEYAIQYVDRVCCQMKAYFTDVYTLSANTSYVNCNGALYPPLACRVENLRRANHAFYSSEVEPIPECVADTLEWDDSFFSESQTKRACEAVCQTCGGNYTMTSGVSRPPECVGCLLVDDRSVIWSKCPGPYVFCSLPPLVYEGAVMERTPGGKGAARKLKRLRSRREKLSERLKGRIYLP